MYSQRGLGVETGGGPAPPNLALLGICDEHKHDVAARSRAHVAADPRRVQLFTATNALAGVA